MSTNAPRAEPSTTTPTVEEIRAFLTGFDLFERLPPAQREEFARYVRVHAKRFRTTLALVPELPAGSEALELGAFPYSLALLYTKWRGLTVATSNFFGNHGDAWTFEDSIQLEHPASGERFAFTFQHFNLECDPFPYADGRFALVSCCEILEHLPEDPSHQLREIHRVLRPGGTLILTTPNALRLANVIDLLRGRNVHAKYSGYGVYGRHNREYAAAELDLLLRVHGFEARVLVRDAYEHAAFHRALTALWRGRRDNLFAIAHKVGPTVQRYPDALYESQGGYRRATSNHVIMGVRDRPQLGSGWSDLEHRPPAVRRADDGALVLLRPRGHETHLGASVLAGPCDTQVHLELEGTDVLSLRVPAGTSAARSEALPAALRARLFDDVRANRKPYLEVRVRARRADGSGPEPVWVEKLGLVPTEPPA